MMKVHISPEQAALQERQEEIIARAAELKGTALRRVLTELFDVSAGEFMPKGKIDPLDSDAREQAVVVAYGAALDYLEETITNAAR